MSVQLPPDIVTKIASFCTLPTIGNLRGACKTYKADIDGDLETRCNAGALGEYPLSTLLIWKDWSSEAVKDAINTEVEHRYGDMSSAMHMGPRFAFHCASAARSLIERRDNEKFERLGKQKRLGKQTKEPALYTEFREAVAKRDEQRLRRSDLLTQLLASVAHVN